MSDSLSEGLVILTISRFYLIYYLYWILAYLYRGKLFRLAYVGGAGVTKDIDVEGDAT